MTRQRALAFPVAALLLVSAACLLYVPDLDWSQAGRTFRRDVAFKPGGTVSLVNEGGYIEIRGWEQNSIRITAEESWFSSFGRRGWLWDRGASYPDVEIDVLDDFVKIQTRVAARGEIARPVHYSLWVPRSVNLKTVRNSEGDLYLADIYGDVRAEVERGDVKIDNFSGSLDVSLEWGSVEAELRDVHPEDEISVNTRSGNITLVLEAEASLNVEVSAAKGAFVNEFDMGRPLAAKALKARLGKAEPATASLVTLDGDISLRKIR